MPRGRGVFVVLEGPDKSGKSTQAKLLSGTLRRRKIPVLHTREPGGTSFAEAVRKIVLNPRLRVDPLAELLLYEAARAQHTSEKVRPALRKGKVVISERYTLATVAYQGYGRGLPLRLVKRLNRIATGGLNPDLTVVLDIPDEEFGSRDARRRHDRLELESSRFRRRVRDGYRKSARAARAAILNGRLPAERLHAEIMARLEKFL